jgi:hypothetical protein
MKHDQTHAVTHYASAEAVDHRFADHVVLYVRPPHEHVGVGKHSIAEALIRVVERGLNEDLLTAPAEPG